MLLKFALPLFTAILLLLSKLQPALSPLVLIGFLPLLFLEDKLQDTRRENWQWVGYSFFAMVVFTVALSLLAHLALSAISILMVSAQFTLVWVLFRFIKLKLGNQRGYIALPFLWVSMEALGQVWQTMPADFLISASLLAATFSAEWLSLPGLYITSLWTVGINLALLGLIKALIEKKKKRTVGFAIATVVLIVLPLLSRVAGEAYQSAYFNFLATRLSYFMAGFLLLFALVRGYLAGKQTQL